MIGVVICFQVLLIYYVNVDLWVWVEMWQIQFFFGMIFYYMFVEWDIGVKYYFEVLLVEVL